MSTATLERPDVAERTAEARDRCMETLTHSEPDAPEADVEIRCQSCGKRIVYCDPCWVVVQEHVGETKQFADVLGVGYWVECPGCKVHGHLDTVFAWRRIR